MWHIQWTSVTDVFYYRRPIHMVPYYNRFTPRDHEDTIIPNKGENYVIK